MADDVRMRVAALQQELRSLREANELLGRQAEDLGFLEARLRDRTRELQEKNALLQAIYDAVPDMIFLHGADGTVEDVNENVLRTFGWTRDEARRIGVAEASGPDMRPEEAMERIRRARAGEPQDFEWTARRKDGTTFPVEVRLRRLEGLPGEPKVLALVRDLTEERRRDQELRVQERLAALGQLAAGIAHDFNNLLTPVCNYPEMLRGLPGVPDRVRRALEVIGEQGQRGARLVHQLLDFGRGSPPDRRVLDLRSFVTEVGEMVRRTLPDAVEVRVEIPEGADLRVWADPVQIQQILVNLAVNARDAMPMGGTLTFAVERVRVPAGTAEPGGPEAGEWVRLTVRDTGEGISPDVLPRIFDPFFTTRGPREGTGLGLSQVHGLVTEHGGRITVETEAGRGTVFRVYLPPAPSPPKGPVEEPTDRR
ncbi:MAG: PAS domain S-box protein [Deltaproteobacteria bacterium]|nr:PAS domain S-box protein [Deltaproteobacteria bacterium]